jgi:hypothetical protein
VSTNISGNDSEALELATKPQRDTETAENTSSTISVEKRFYSILYSFGAAKRKQNWWSELGTKKKFGAAQLAKE